jgi:predicted metal-binding protein
MSRALDRLFVCVTCVRDTHGAVEDPTRGWRLAEALEAALAGAPDLGKTLSLRRVECLNSCLSPCAVALRCPGKAGHRISRLQPEHAAAVVQLATAYVAAADGEIPLSAWPEPLQDKRTAHVPGPRRPDAA